jgi:uncharacterized paraquat-inducible protein A
MSWQDDEDDTVPCPYCRRSIHEDSVRCPHCENYLSEEDAPSQRSWWFILGALVCLLLAAGWALQML